MIQFNILNINKKDIKLIKLVKKTALSIIMVIIILAVLFNCFIVQEDEIVFVCSFGRVIRVIDDPGLYFKMPFINTTSAISKKVHCNELQTMNIQTKDNKNILIDNYVLWMIDDPKSFFNTLQTVEYAEFKIENILTAAISSKLMGMEYNDIIIGKVNYYEDIISAVRNELSTYGIEVIDTKFKNIYLSQEDQYALLTRMKSEKEKLAAQYLSIGEKEAAMIKAEVDKDVKVIISKAQAESEKIKGTADAEAARIYAESYNKDPEFYRFIRTMESYRKTLINKPTIIIPIDSPFARYLLGK